MVACLSAGLERSTLFSQFFPLTFSIRSSGEAQVPQLTLAKLYIQIYNDETTKRDLENKFFFSPMSKNHRERARKKENSSYFVGTNVETGKKGILLFSDFARRFHFSP